MLKAGLLPTNYNTYADAKCGEIICQNENCFTIVCVFCKMKLFELEDFVLHFRNVHLRELSSKKDVRDVNTIKLEQEEDAAIAVKFETVECVLDELNESDATDGAYCRVDIEGDKADSTDSEHTHDDAVLQPGSWSGTSSAEDDEEEEEEVLTKILQKKPPPRKQRKKNICPICNKTYASTQYMLLHMKKHHNKDNPKCEHCDATFTDERLLLAHQRKEHYTFMCATCSKMFKSADLLKQHSVVHRPTKDFVCPFESCGKAFASLKRLNQHKHIHSGERNYVCEVCGNRFRVRSALLVHRRSHTGEKPFACDDCGKRFSSSSMLIEHKPIHSTERPHKCNVCDAAFSRRKALYHHKHLHLGVKKFKCKICGNAYAQMAGLSGHMRQHKMDGLI